MSLIAKYPVVATVANEYSVNLSHLCLGAAF